MARPTKLTHETQEKILLAIRDGNYREVAAQWAGVSPETVSRWMRRGEREGKGDYYEFRQAVLEAEQHAEIVMVRLVRAGANTDPKHAEWWLERKAHDRWGRRERVELSGDAKRPITIQAFDYNAAIAALAPRSMGDSGASGADEGRSDGAQMGQDADGG